MDDKNAMIVDISSDEDNGGGGGGEGEGEDFYSVSKLLHDDKNDDVVIVGEVFVNKKQRIKSSKDVNNDDDDDCVVLDGDPDKPVTVDNETNGDDDDDFAELVIISEKGEVACRDFPHPRHLCARFPFASTPHQSHCNQCHCYVCDSRAPCGCWGSGNFKIDHCHANEKEQFWKTQRKYIKRNDKDPPVATDSTLSIRRLFKNQPPLSISNRVAQIQVSGQASIRPCSVPTSNGAPNFTRQGRGQPPGTKLFLPHLVSHHLNRVSNHAISKVNKHNTRNINPFKSRQVMTATRMRTPTRPTLDNGVANSFPSQHIKSYANLAPSDPQMSSQQHISGVSQTPSQQEVTGHFANSVPSQSHVGGFLGNLSPSQPLIASQPLAGDNFENIIPAQPQVVPSQHSRGLTLQNPVPSPPMLSSVPYTKSTFESSCSPQLQEYSQSTFMSNDTQNIFQQGNQSEDFFASDFADSDFCLFNYTSPNCPQPSLDNSQPQSADASNNPSADMDIYSHYPTSTDFGPPDLQFDSWIIENQSVSGAVEDSVLPGLNAPFPEPASIDGGLFFDL